MGSGALFDDNCGARHKFLQHSARSGGGPELFGPEHHSLGIVFVAVMFNGQGAAKSDQQDGADERQEDRQPLFPLGRVVKEKVQAEGGEAGQHQEDQGQTVEGEEIGDLQKKLGQIGLLAFLGQSRGAGVDVIQVFPGLPVGGIDVQGPEEVEHGPAFVPQVMVAHAQIVIEVGVSDALVGKGLKLGQGGLIIRPGKLGGGARQRSE